MEDKKTLTTVGETNAGHLFITNMRDARRKQRNIIVLLAILFLTFFIPQLNPVPPVQRVTRDLETRRTTVTQFIDGPSAYASIFVGNSNPVQFRAGFEQVINFRELPEILQDTVVFEVTQRDLHGTAPSWIIEGTIGILGYPIALVLAVQLLLLGLGMYGLTLSYKERERLRGIGIMRTAALCLAGSYLLLLLLLTTFNMMAGYVVVFGLPGGALIGLAVSIIIVRQVFMVRWFTHPETVMVKEVTHLSYYTSKGKKECPHCHAEVLETLESCPQCGLALTERWKCRDCGQINTASRELCYSCGHPPRLDPRTKSVDTIAP